MATLKRLSFLFITLFLFACNSSDLDHDTTIKNDVTIKSNNMLTIETVEFSGTNAVRNVGVKLIDNITGEQLAKAVSNDEGKVHFKQLEKKNVIS